MKVRLLVLFICLAWNGWAESFTPYSPDSLKKGDWITLELVGYHPYVAPGIKEEIPWKAENICRIIIQATVTDATDKTLSVDYILDNLYDCRNDQEKQGFYYFDSRYQKDFAFEDTLRGKLINHTVYDRKNGKVLTSNYSNLNYAYEAVFIPFGVRTGDLSASSVKPLQDSIKPDKLLTDYVPDLISKWQKNNSILSGNKIRVINASFGLPPNTRFTCTYYDFEKQKYPTITQELFLPYPTTYVLSPFDQILLTPGDSITGYLTRFTNTNTKRFLGRGAEQNNFRHQYQHLAYGYGKYDLSTPEKLKRAFHLRDSIYPVALAEMYEKMDPYWRRVFELSEHYMKGTYLLKSHSEATDKEIWRKSGLINWKTAYFASVNPLIDHFYNQGYYDVTFYSSFINYYSIYKMQEITADNINVKKNKEITPQEEYVLGKQLFQGFPKYLISNFTLGKLMYRNSLKEAKNEYDDLIRTHPDTVWTNRIKQIYNQLEPLESGNNIKETGLYFTDSLPLVKGSDRKYILINISGEDAADKGNMEKAEAWREKLKTEGLEQDLKLILSRVIPSHNSEKAKQLYQAIPTKYLHQISSKIGGYQLTILMREDGTILHRQFEEMDLDMLLKLTREDRARKETDFVWSSFLYGFLAMFLIASIVGLLVRFRVKAKQKKEQARRQVSELELRAIRSQMNPHFIFNALSSIQNLINRSANQKANEYLINFSRLLRKVLATSEKKLVPLSDEIEQLQLYLGLEQLRFPFTYSLEVEEGIEPDLIEIPGMLIQPFVENAVKHGISPKGGGEIQIHLSLQDQRLIIDITDDGPGPKTSKSDGFGIRAISSQLEILKTLYNTDLGVTIENRQEKEAVSGCRVRLSIPL